MEKIKTSPRVNAPGLFLFGVCGARLLAGLAGQQVEISSHIEGHGESILP